MWFQTLMLEEWLNLRILEPGGRIWDLLVVKVEAGLPWIE